MLRKLRQNIQQKWRDLWSRAGWTALQAALGILTLEALGVPLKWVVIAAPAYSALKSYVAAMAGNASSVTFVEPTSGPLRTTSTLGAYDPAEPRRRAPGRARGRLPEDEW